MAKALISVSDKRGLEELARSLNKLNIEILSTGGTARKIHEAGIPVTEVSEYTGFPESPDGLVKTLHPKLQAGWLLNQPSKEDYMAFCVNQRIEPIDYVIVNLYPFEEYIQKNPDCTLEEAMAEMDIGGPTMVRGAAKAALKYGTTTVVTSPDSYPALILDLDTGRVSDQHRKQWALMAIDLTASYDNAIRRFVREKLYR